jgi:hypothetical protein
MTWSASRRAKVDSLSFVMPRLDNGVQPRRVCAVKEHSAIKDVIALDLWFGVMWADAAAIPQTLTSPDNPNDLRLRLKAPSP